MPLNLRLLTAIALLVTVNDPEQAYAHARSASVKIQATLTVLPTCSIISPTGRFTCSKDVRPTVFFAYKRSVRKAERSDSKARTKIRIVTLYL